MNNHKSNWWYAGPHQWASSVGDHGPGEQSQLQKLLRAPLLWQSEERAIWNRRERKTGPDSMTGPTAMEIAEGFCLYDSFSLLVWIFFYEAMKHCFLWNTDAISSILLHHSLYKKRRSVESYASPFWKFLNPNVSWLSEAQINSLISWITSLYLWR